MTSCQILTDENKLTTEDIASIFTRSQNISNKNKNEKKRNDKENISLTKDMETLTIKTDQYVIGKPRPKIFFFIIYIILLCTFSMFYISKFFTFQM